MVDVIRPAEQGLDEAFEDDRVALLPVVNVLFVDRRAVRADEFEFKTPISRG